ncbi:GNAT family N-acetyltransferase [Streptomyces erythrochromogenes]|uniref:GNAT family N-acetyltransferase n=1 Tax=Streptomyces erythrochromogenes TaxID=285574 RepID=UPI00225C0015|nr:GNAT family N-acetyltransferase [Streptomyces erythrochromogenes]MCX5587123.1 GNAT family N-acetyltransferase [Streptomyces erythrochromogenes]
MNFTVRRAGPGDGDVLGEIHAAAWETAYAPFFDPGFAADGIASRRTRWHARLAAQDSTILLAEGDGRPVAMAVFRPSSTRPRFAEILSFYSHPDSWGTGAAAALMTGTLGHLSADGFTRAHLWTLRDTPQSRRFYTKAGFTESGSTRTYDFGDGNPLTQVEFERGC